MLELPKLRESEDYKLSAAKMRSFRDSEENIVENGQNANFHHFLLFPPSFLKSFLSGLLKVRIDWKRINSLPYKPDF